VREIYAHPRVRAWHREMIDYFDSLNHGGQPVSTHYSGHYRIVDPRMVALPQIDYMACDAYHEGRTTLLQLLRRSDHFAERFGKPYLITEFGGTPFGGTWELLEADLHAGLWASWMSHASGTALFWWFEHIDRAKLYPHYRALANYIEGEDKRRGPAQPPLQKLRFLVEDAGGERVRGLRGAGLSDGDVGYAWIYDEDAMRELPREDDEWPSYEAMTALIPGMKSGAVRVEFWDTWSGEVIREAVFEKGEDERRLAVRLPRFSTDIALKLRHVSSAPAGRAPPSARDGSGGAGPHAPDEAPAP
jgi:hypothetical protein